MIISLPLFGSLILFVTLLEILSLSILGILVTLLVGQELENSKFYFIFNFFQNFFHKNNSTLIFCVILLIFLAFENYFNYFN